MTKSNGVPVTTFYCRRDIIGRLVRATQADDRSRYEMHYCKLPPALRVELRDGRLRRLPAVLSIITASYLYAVEDEVQNIRREVIWYWSRSIDDVSEIGKRQRGPDVRILEVEH